jgi:hypothetical protein
MKSVEGQLGVYSLSLLLIAVLTIVIPGCGASSSQKGESDQYTITPGRINRFYVVSSDLDPARKPRYIEYLFTGMIRNNTTNTYASSYLTMRVSIELENGNVLEEKDLNDIPFNDILSHKSFENWKPGQTIEVSRLVSISIPVGYADYPAKDIILNYSLDLEDKINQTHEKIDLEAVSVIDKWRAAVAKAKAGKVDADDYNFPGKILNGPSKVGRQDDEDKKELINE